MRYQNGDPARTMLCGLLHIGVRAPASFISRIPLDEPAFIHQTCPFEKSPGFMVSIFKTDRCRFSQHSTGNGRKPRHAVPQSSKME